MFAISLLTAKLVTVKSLNAVMLMPLSNDSAAALGSPTFTQPPLLGLKFGASWLMKGDINK